MPSSTEILCNTPSDPFNGKVNLNVQNLIVGAVVAFSCDPGYSLVGNVSITCEQEGVVGMWSNDIPTCDGKKCIINLLYVIILFFYNSDRVLNGEYIAQWNGDVQC